MPTPTVLLCAAFRKNRCHHPPRLLSSLLWFVASCPREPSPATRTPPPVGNQPRGQIIGLATDPGRSKDRNSIAHPRSGQSRITRPAAPPRPSSATSAPTHSTLSSQATENADPEVAASARYLLRQITVRWVQERRFGRRPPADALLRQSCRTKPACACVAELAKLANREGLGRLCRIVRYDRSPLDLARGRPGDHSARRGRGTPHADRP